MKIPAISLEDLSQLIDAQLVGLPQTKVTGINEIHVVRPGDVVFVDHPKYYDKALSSNATVVIIDKAVDCPVGKGLLVVKDPFRAFNFLINYFSPFEFSSSMRGLGVQIGKYSRIHDSVSLGNNVRIGENCIIHPNVSIYDNCVIGNNVIIHSGVVIGSHGFYYKNRGETFERLNSGGNVVIEDFVEIGANTTIDKGVTSSTRIGAHTVIDNLVQIGHDTVIGTHCLIAAQTGLAGCIVIKDNVSIWGQVGMKSGVEIGDNAVVLAQSGVTKSLKGNQQYWGTPAIPFRKKLKEIALIQKIPYILEEL